MKRKGWIFSFLMIHVFALNAQTKTLTLEEAVQTRSAKQ